MSLPLPSDQYFDQRQASPVAKVLARLRDDIAETWERKLRQQSKSAAELSRPVLINTIPKFLDNLTEALSGTHPRLYATDGTNIPEEHGGARARLSKYGPDQLILEYQLLREVIFDKLAREIELSDQERRVIERSIDNGLRESMVQFFFVQTKLNEQFVAALTHDMRNPLAANKMSIEFMIKTLESPVGEPEKAQLQHLCHRALGNAKRVDKMIQDLLDSNLLNSGDVLPLKLGECDILEVLKSVIADLSPKEQARIKLKETSCRGLWDKEALCRAIENIINNAIKYGDESKPIGVMIVPAFERMQLSVHNEGKPIPVEEQKKLFEPFHRAKSAKEGGQKGWGIGLSLTHGVAISHGGSLLLESTAETGTTFTLDLPLDPSKLKVKGQ
jgi:signal transduction histidine kinase